MTAKNGRQIIKKNTKHWANTFTPDKTNLQRQMNTFYFVGDIF